MGVARSSCYAVPAAKPDETALVAEIAAICAGFPAYGYRRVGAELRHRGRVVNAKKLRRILREQGLNPRQRRRRVATTTSNSAAEPPSRRRPAPDGGVVETARRADASVQAPAQRLV